MDRLDEDIETTVHSLLFILKQLGGRADFHKVFKIMYFADQKHLTKFGASISNDKYIAMQNGPVPSMTYDILKALRGEGLLVGLKDRFTPYFNLIKSYTVEAKLEPELENLSESEISAIRESIHENKNLNFEKLTEKSHDYAWKKAMRDGEIDLIDIAEAGGASKDMVKYIQNHLENLHAAFE
jgi:uncharacterized phage-associated protein